MNKNAKTNPVVTIIIAVLIVIFITMLIIDLCTPQYGWFAKVDAGYAGVVDYFGDVKDQPLKPGFHTTRYFEHVHPVSVRTEKTTYEVIAFSSDIQQVIMIVSINSNVSEESAGVLYKRVGMSYKETLIGPKIQENTKVVVSAYTAEKLIEQREDLSGQILEKMQHDISPYGINVTDVAIENIDFTDAFESAVEAKQVATQEKQRAKTQQEQATMEAQQAAEREKIKAEAEANVEKIKADAEAYSIKAKAQAEAEANKQISESLTDSLIEYTKAQNWDGKLPTTFAGSDNNSIIPIIQNDEHETVADSNN